MAKIFHAHLHGYRETKYDRLMEFDISNTAWSEVSPQPPFYLLIPQDTQLSVEYAQGWKITEIMPASSVGVVTAQDSKTIACCKSDVELLADTHGLPTSVIASILYRPFDKRFIVYDSQVVTRPRREIMQHMVAGENLGLISNRQIRLDEVKHFFVSDCIVENKILETANGAGYLFPLYLRSNALSENLGSTRRPNLSQPFLNDITAKLGYTPTPEAIFYYIYAIFHSPIYRSRYAEFLKIDFPRVPLTRNVALFRQLSAYGEQLVALHLMKAPNLDRPITQFIDQGGNAIVDVGHPKYTNGKVTINKKGDGFEGVPEAVWNFYVGGYPVCAKWLKDRKGRTLSPDDITHYQRIVVALSETITLMAAIDQAIPGFPIE